MLQRGVIARLFASGCHYWRGSAIATSNVIAAAAGSRTLPAHGGSAADDSRGAGTYAGPPAGIDGPEALPPPSERAAEIDGRRR